MAECILWERYLPDLSLGRHTVCYDEVNSTMDTAWAIVEHGPAHGLAVQSLEQRSGRGRFGRRWEGGRAESLLQSVIVVADAGTLASLSMAACVAVVHAAESLAGVACRIKWPNDVHVGGRKLCGVLVESRVDTDGNGVAVVGYGLNVNAVPATISELKGVSTSLAGEAGRRFDLTAASDAMLATLDAAYTGLAQGDTLQAYRRLVDTTGRVVTVRQGEAHLEGVAEGISGSGALILRTADGTAHELNDGEVTVTRVG
jgi:BirA family biotin operon repressor/biotin-[acetyl-CoA-carboxylase] ligase